MASFFSSVQRETSTFCAFMHIYQLLHHVLSTSFSTHPKPLTWVKKPFQSKRVHFCRHYETFFVFRHCETEFFQKLFLLFLPSILDILDQNGYSNNLKVSPFYVFRHYGNFFDLPEISEKFRKQIGFFFSFLSFSRTFVSSCRKSGLRFRVFFSLRYGADLGRSRLVLLIY